MPPTTSWTTCVVIIDNNGLQIDGTVGEVMSPYPIRREARGLRLCMSMEIDGHDFDQIEAAFAEAKGRQGQAHRHCR